MYGVGIVEVGGGNVGCGFDCFDYGFDVDGVGCGYGFIYFYVCFEVVVCCEDYGILYVWCYVYDGGSDVVGGVV